MRQLAFILLAFLSVACYPTRIVTYSPAPSASRYTTVVTSTGTRNSTTISQIVTPSEDISLHLDLQAVAALFAQSSTVQEFEQLLNSPSYPVSNLDLNQDGFIDYLRVLETVDGFRHAFLIQAVLGNNIFQDVATLVAEIPSYSNYRVEIIGAPFIYGPSYIVRPVFVARPPMFDHFLRPRYSPWRSPWYWGHYPPHYKHYCPVYLNHYQAYVRTYMHSHRYCHEMHYPPRPFYDHYDRMVYDYRRNDYGARHPEKSFSARNGGPSNSKIHNAYDIRKQDESSKITTVTTGRETSNTGRGTGNTSTAGSSSSNNRAATQAVPSTSQVSPSTSASSTSTNRRVATPSTNSSTSRTSTSSSAIRNSSSSSSSRTSSSQSSSNVTSRVRNSGSSSTTVRNSSSSSRSSTNSSSSSSVRRSSSSSTSSSASRNSSSSSTRSSTSSSRSSASTNSNSTSRGSSSTSRSSSSNGSSSSSRGSRR